MKRIEKKGFTLIELLIVITVLGILASIAIARYRDLVQKSQEGANRGNLGNLRSALNIYYSDNEQTYPRDNLDALKIAQKYYEDIPELTVGPVHTLTKVVTTESTPTETGTWSYNNSDATSDWGKVVIGCLHTDLRGNVWTTY